MPPRAVLFDFDGVIADTENVHIAAWERTFGDIGLEIPAGDCARAAEVDDRAFLAEVFARRQLRDANIAGWVRRKQELTVALLADAPRLFPGLAALIRRLQPNTRLAVVSTTWRANIETVLRAAGLADAFELVVAKEDVEAPKPDPACYRLALARLRLSAPAAVALEDSPTGIASARAAGLRPVAVGHRRPPGDWNGTAPYLPDFTDIDAVLRTLEF